MWHTSCSFPSLQCLLSLWSNSNSVDLIRGFPGVVVGFQSPSRVQLFATQWTAAHQASCASPSPGACTNSCPLSWWCHPTISSSVIPFCCLQSFPASRYFLVSQLLTSRGQSIDASAPVLVLPMNIQCWFPLRLTDLISLLSKGLSRVFSNTTVRKHQFFSAQPSLQSNSHIHVWLLEKP